ncbi:MAG: hypothetical protein CSA09_00760 [Candidatus Contendobacter odensis]|uniref:Mce/MlaD domain-containing protein n=1 Tax=Candidatus Contendibacter odensensis TaxID=1400860 RepID=A0A2G6PGY4_9GAMM|nr:MAG: hypothetical protein CSA09_00760 [Candidatus Contendobacter odensis]
MQSHVNYALVGLFVTTLGCSLLGVTFWLVLGGKTKEYDQYRVYFNESVAGLNIKATVRYRGVQVGQVASIRLQPDNPDRVDVVLDIEQGTPIYRNTIATLSTRGLTGVATIELSGDGQALPLEKQPDQELPIIQAGPSLVARLDDAFNNILSNIDKLAKRLEQLLNDDNQLAIKEILQHISRITGATADRSNSLRQTLTHVETITGALAHRSDSIRHTLSNVEKFTGVLAQRAEHLGTALDQAIKVLKDSGNTSKQIRVTLNEFRASARSVRQAADHFDKTSLAFTQLAQNSQREIRLIGQNTLPEFNELLMQANELLVILKRVATLLEQNPNILIVGNPDGRPDPGAR